MTLPQLALSAINPLHLEWDKRMKMHKQVKHKANLSFDYLNGVYEPQTS